LSGYGLPGEIFQKARFGQIEAIPGIRTDRGSDYPGGVLTGRSFESVRMGVKGVSERWLRARRALKREDMKYADKLAEMARRHSSEAFYAFEDPLEAALFSVLVEMLKEIEGRDVDPGRKP